MSAIKQAFDITVSVQTLFERHAIAEFAEIVEEALLRAAHPQEVGRILAELGVNSNV